MVIVVVGKGGGKLGLVGVWVFVVVVGVECRGVVVVGIGGWGFL